MLHYENMYGKYFKYKEWEFINKEKIFKKNILCYINKLFWFITNEIKISSL
jgi:hypothetical protein